MSSWTIAKKGKKFMEKLRNEASSLDTVQALYDTIISLTRKNLFSIYPTLASSCYRKCSRVSLDRITSEKNCYPTIIAKDDNVI